MRRAGLLPATCARCRSGSLKPTTAPALRATSSWAPRRSASPEKAPFANHVLKLLLETPVAGRLRAEECTLGSCEHCEHCVLLQQAASYIIFTLGSEFFDLGPVAAVRGGHGDRARRARDLGVAERNVRDGPGAFFWSLHGATLAEGMKAAGTPAEEITEGFCRELIQEVSGISEQLLKDVKCLGKMAEKAVAPPKIFTVMTACGGGIGSGSEKARMGGRGGGCNRSAFLLESERRAVADARRK
ncbi:unnamed protein product [Prorocentrum cordatum]|uniref:Uncharacterized protein n=1 Tax=Prorocentrum cordatum TaxID=2364126 RepID=A0ABN9VE81_9DINO|nr:unnamed protein product [Polarella glacialis]